MAGTSNRFHRGYQYALSDQTAKTLRDDHHRFQAVYGPCVLASANYYGIAADSQLSCLRYLDFCARCQLPVRLEKPAGIFTDRVLLSLLSAEKSLDLDALRRLCRQKLKEHGVDLVFATATPALLRGYDYVVSAVYGNPNDHAVGTSPRTMKARTFMATCWSSPPGRTTITSASAK